MKSIEAVDEKEISLSQVRQELSSIKGNLSETISKQREERG
jgi:flagellar biosynthesis chaperone FliJ